MVITSMVISLVLTLGILLLSILTISKGYGFKHTIDPKPEEGIQDAEGESKKFE